MKVDLFENVFVAGRTVQTNAGGAGDYLLEKFDGAGNSIWRVTYNGSAIKDDYATDLAFGVDGKIYVTGASRNRTSLLLRAYDFVTIKYNTNGSRAWVARFDGREGESIAKAVAVDTNENVYVTGTLDLGTNGTRICTVKYDKFGIQQWQTTYGTSPTVPTAMVLDTNGNIYVVGNGSERGAGQNFVALKYSTSGQLLWAKSFNDLGNNYQALAACALAQNGNLYFAGISSIPPMGFAPYLTMAYDENSDSFWTRHYFFNGHGATAITVNLNGEIFVTGGTGEATQDIITLKYDSNGNEVWSSRFPQGGNNDVRGQSIVSDVDGSVYVTGAMNLGKQFVILKLDENGNQIWSSLYGGTSSANTDALTIYPTRLCVSSNKNVFALCTTGGSYRVAKFSPSYSGGNPIISKLPLRIETSDTPILISGSASGNPPLYYQWRKNGIPISSQSLASIEASYGKYSLAVSNQFGFSVSPEITVSPPTVFQSTIIGSNGIGFTFLFEQNRLYQIQTSTDFSNWTGLTNFWGWVWSSNYLEVPISNVNLFYRVEKLP